MRYADFKFPAPFLAVLLTAFSLLLFNFETKGQAALIALLFGDKVASENFNLSLEVGMNFSDISNFENAKKRRGAINFGIAGNIRLSDNWYVSPNVYFWSRRRLHLNSFSLYTGNPSIDSQFVDVPTNFVMNYIDVPVLFSYQTDNKKFRFSTGPQLSFMQNTTASFSGVDGDFEQDFNELVHDIDFGALIDVAYILGKAHKGKGLHLHFRYYYGFTNVFDNGVLVDDNQLSFYSFHISLPFITDELAARNLEN